MNNREYQRDQRLSRAQKEANDFRWYKDKIDLLDKGSTSTTFGSGGSSEFHRMKVNYDLYNNIIDLSDFEYICKPFGDGEEGFELPANMVNRDILSNKIKVILGMEMRRPFDYKVLAINPEATTRKEQEEFGRVRDFVISTITTPIRQQIEIQQQQELQGRELTAEEKQTIQQNIEAELRAQTPDEVKVYMEREHQDPAEVMSHQLLQYLTIRRDLPAKFNLGTKHAAITAKEFYWVGEVNGEPDVRVCNPLRSNYSIGPDIEFVEDGEWFTYEYRMSPSDVVAFFADELSESEIDSIYKDHFHYTHNLFEQDLFSFRKGQGTFSESDYLSDNTVRVLHGVWKSLREIKFLSYEDENGEVQEMIVDETYKLNPAMGDISITSEWIPECYETYKIGSDIYKKMRPVPGQFKDMDNLYECKLPYKGSIYDATNSTPTSMMDRGKVWQYYLDIIYYRLELMMASDKGKKVLMNINAIPDSAGIDIEKFQYYMESSPFAWYNPNEEGVGYNDVNSLAKVIDLSLASDMMKYLELAERVKQECGEAMGVSRQMEAQLEQRDAVANTRQALIQNSYILEPFFNLHNRIKKNVLTALIETAKICYSAKKPQKLYYALDDMSMRTLDIDPAMLDNSTLSLFVNDTSKAQEIKDTITQLAHAALQNQQVKLSDILSIIKEDSITVAEERLLKSEKEQQEFQQQLQQQNIDAQKQLQQAQAQQQKEEWANEKDTIVLKEEERRKTELMKAAMTGMSFNPDADSDNDGENDFFEIAKHSLDAEIKRSKDQLDREKFEHQKVVDKAKIQLDKEKIQVAKQKSNSPNK